MEQCDPSTGVPIITPSNRISIIDVNTNDSGSNNDRPAPKRLLTVMASLAIMIPLYALGYSFEFLDFLSLGSYQSDGATQRNAKMSRVRARRRNKDRHLTLFHSNAAVPLRNYRNDTVIANIHERGNNSSGRNNYAATSSQAKNSTLSKNNYMQQQQHQSKEKFTSLSNESPACNPHFNVALPGGLWSNNKNGAAPKFKRLYFYHARKAGGTTLAHYFAKVARHHGLEFNAVEWEAAEEPGMNEQDVNTFYVTHLREPVDRAISHFKYQGRWHCRELIKMRRKGFVPTEENANKLETWNKTGGHVETTCSKHKGTEHFRLGECAVNCYSQWFSGLSCPEMEKSIEEMRDVAKARLLRYNFIVILEKLRDPSYVDAVEKFFDVPGVTESQSAFCEKPSHKANIINPLVIHNKTRNNLVKLNKVDLGLYNEMSNCLNSGDYEFPTFDPTRFATNSSIQVPHDKFDEWKRNKGKKNSTGISITISRDD